jgi:hypothetical protein
MYEEKGWLEAHKALLAGSEGRSPGGVTLQHAVVRSRYETPGRKRGSSLSSSS